MKKKSFKSPKEWRDFSKYIQEQNRFHLTGKWKDFFKKVKKTARNRVSVLSTNKEAYRARIGDGGFIKGRGYVPKKANELGVTPREQSRDNRANPSGIPYLYLANSVETAISEIRPALTDHVSVGTFTLPKGMKFLVTTQDKKVYSLLDEILDLSGKKKYTDKQIEDYIWGDINKAFSEPIRSNERKDKYLATQYLAEVVKNIGVDAIFYKSAVHKKGFNIVVFNVAKLKFRAARLFKVTDINYKSEEID